MKRIILILVILLLSASQVHGESNLDGLYLDSISSLSNTNEIEGFIDSILQENNISQSMKAKDLISRILKGEDVLEKKSIYQSIKAMIVEEISLNLSLLVKILVITLISAVLTNLQGTFEKSSISQLANYSVYILAGILVITNFTGIMKIMETSVERMSDLMELLLPVLLSLLIVTSGPSAKVMLHPMVLAVVNLVGIIIKSIIIPLIYFSFVLGIISNLSNKIELNKLSDLSKKIVIFIISGAFTIFIGILSIYGLSNKIDGLSIRTAKFAVDKFVPIVGGFLSDSVDTVISSTAILRNGIGIVGLIALVLVILAPIVRITITLFFYTLAGAIIEPIAAKNISKFFSDLSSTILLILVSLVSMGIMFFITITMIVDTGNNLLMLR